jgi:hypothetical protein
MTVSPTMLKRAAKLGLPYGENIQGLSKSEDQIMQSILDGEIDLEQSSAPAMLIATRNNRKDVIQYLVSNWDYEGRRPDVAVLAHGLLDNLEKVKTLLEKKEMEASGGLKASTCILARFGKTKALGMIIHRRPALDLRQHEHPMLREAALNDHIGTTKLILEQTGAAKRLCDDEHMILRKTAKNGFTDIVCLLLKHYSRPKLQEALNIDCTPKLLIQAELVQRGRETIQKTRTAHANPALEI